MAADATTGRIRSLATTLRTPVDAASLIAFRTLFGALMAVAALRFFAHGWIDELYLRPAVHFTYTGFAWIAPWPGRLLYLHFAALALAAAALAAGWHHRAATATFLVLFTYVELLDKTTYLNHYYLVTLIAALLLPMPLDRAAHRDATGPGPRHAPRWCLWALRAQVGIVYAYAGLAKLTPDWLLAAQPLRLWLNARADLPGLGPLLSLPPSPWLASWLGAALDLLAPLLLSWPRTRLWMLAALVLFHALTAVLFPLGLFPWIMIAAATLFLPPDWPRRTRATLLSLPLVAACPPLAPLRPARAAWLGSLLLLHFAFQLLWPLRHLLHPGPVAWTEDGFRFSWRVMLMEKTGYLAYDAHDPATGRHWRIYPQDELTPFQSKMIATQPDLILAYAHHLAAAYATRGIHAEIRADSWVSLNGRPPAAFVDPTVDLARVDDAGDRWWLRRAP